MQFEAAPAIDFSNLSLVPRNVSSIGHRADVDCSVALGPATLEIPLIGSPMPDVCGPEMCVALARLGAVGILHRFQPLRAQVEQFAAAATSVPAGRVVGAAVGTTGDFRERFTALCEAGCRVVCLDTANGAHTQVAAAIEWVKRVAPDAFVIAGNVGSAETFRWLEDHGADAVRVGIGGGALCETRTETGIYAPTPQAVLEAAGERRRALIIGDGGVRNPGDLCKLLALGADVVMLGSALAGTREAAGREVMMRGRRYKVARGAASLSVQLEMGHRDPPHAEGAETMVPYRGETAAVVHRYAAGLRSSMAYLDARDLAAFRANARFIRVP
ncbi:MAG TPA: guanosine monophosphate reductase [Terriglobales bacterium]|nr:guanosine monophosphate reductase [Terriglobales bacterium]